jgi:hypothetical protein
MQMPNDISSRPKTEASEIGFANVCWRKDWQRPYESLWSLLKKFAYLNVASVPDVRTLVGRRNKGEYPYGPFRADLNSLVTVDPVKLQNLLAVDETTLLQSTALGYVRFKELVPLASVEVRFCVTCINDGFHSPFHQLLFFSHCPIHQSPLINCCPACGTVTRRYTLSSISSPKVTDCAHCPSRLIDNFCSHTHDDLEEESKGRELEQLGQWLRSRSMGHDCSESWLHGAGPKLRKPSKWQSQRLLRLPRYWSEALSFKSRMPFARLPKREAHRFVSTSNRSMLPGAVLYACGQVTPEFQKQLAAVYKSISRNLRKRILRNHEGCIRALGKHVCWAASGRFCRGTICVAANAFLLWRMVCEGVNDPKMLFLARAKDTLDQMFEDVDLGASPLSKWSTQRIFALNWLGLFYECLLLSKYVSRRGLYSFSPSLIKGTRKPHWIVECSPERIETVHWWMENRHMLPIIKDRSYCLAPDKKNKRCLWKTYYCYCLTQRD